MQRPTDYGATGVAKEDRRPEFEGIGVLEKAVEVSRPELATSPSQKVNDAVKLSPPV